MTDRVHSVRFGRRLDDFRVGAVFEHPWEVTVDDGMRALFDASFLDATPTYASRIAAASIGLRDRPLHPLLLLNLGLSFSVHDVSEQAIAHLAYVSVRFPNACYAGDTVRAESIVLGATPTSDASRGIVSVRTNVRTADGNIVCAFERKALVPAGRSNAPEGEVREVDARGDIQSLPSLPSEVHAGGAAAAGLRGFGGFWEDFRVGDVFAHSVGRTVGESEHMQLATLFRNTHPLHGDEVYCASESFAKTRVVYGGLVLAWALALASRDTAGRALWDMELSDGAHPAPVVAGDTLYAASKVLAKADHGPHTGTVTLRVVGAKNVESKRLIESGVDLFAPEKSKGEGKIAEKVVEITRTLLVRKRG